MILRFIFMIENVIRRFIRLTQQHLCGHAVDLGQILTYESIHCGLFIALALPKTTKDNVTVGIIRVYRVERRAVRAL